MANEALVAQLGRADGRRLRDYRDNLRFYAGEQWLGTPRRRERWLVVNYARALIDKAAAYTLAGMQTRAAAGAAGGDAALEALAVVGEANDLAGLDFDAEIDCSVLGDGAWKVTWDVDASRVRVVAPDVQGLYVWPWPHDLHRYWRVAERYGVTAEELALVLGGAGGGAAPAPPVENELAGLRARRSGDRHELVEVWTDFELEIYVDGRLAEARANPYGVIPYVVYPNFRVPKQFWGQSDIEAVREIQRELNRAVTQLSKILEVSGNPIAVLEGVSDAQGIAAEPGAVWTLPEDTRAYLLDFLQGGGVRLHADYIELLYRMLHDLGESPRVSFGEADSSASSGVALELQLDPLVKKVERKRLVRAAAFRRRNELVLRLLDQFTGSSLAGVVTSVGFGAVVPTDRGRLVNEEATLVGSGLHSRATGARALAVEEPETEFGRWLDEERRLQAVQGGGLPGAGAGAAAGDGP